MNHEEARRIVDSLGVSPLESLFLRGVAWHETNYGQGWKPGSGEGSNNMGAITTKKPDQYSFQHADVRNDQGQVVHYTTWFKGYKTPRQGFEDLKHTVLRPNVKAGIARAGLRGGLAAMHENGYFLGVHRRDTAAGREANVTDYFNAVVKGLHTIGASTREDVQKLISHVGHSAWALVAATAAAIAGGLAFWRFAR